MDDAMLRLQLRSMEVSIVALADRLAALENRGQSDTASTWRTGTSVGNTIYRGNAFAGSCVSPEVARDLVEAANARQQRVDKLMVEIGREPNHTDVIQPCSCDEALRLRGVIAAEIACIERNDLLDRDDPVLTRLKDALK